MTRDPDTRDAHTEHKHYDVHCSKCWREHHASSDDDYIHGPGTLPQSEGCGCVRCAAPHATPCERCGGGGWLTIFDNATRVDQICSPIGDEPCPDCSPSSAREECEHE